MGEQPGAATFVGGAIVVAAVILQARDRPTPRRGRLAAAGAAEAEHPPI
jgi:hypothetical protein